MASHQHLPHATQETWQSALNSTPSAAPLSVPASHGVIDQLHSHTSDNNSDATTSTASPPNLDFYAYDASPADSSARISPAAPYTVQATTTASSSSCCSPPQLLRHSPPPPALTARASATPAAAAAGEEVLSSLSQSDTRGRHRGMTGAGGGGKGVAEQPRATLAPLPASLSSSTSLTYREVGPAASTGSHVSHVSHISVDSRTRRRRHTNRTPPNASAAAAAASAPTDEHGSPAPDCISPFLNGSVPNEANSNAVLYNPSDYYSEHDGSASYEGSSDHSVAVSGGRPSSRYISVASSHLQAPSVGNGEREAGEGYVLFPVDSGSSAGHAVAQPTTAKAAAASAAPTLAAGTLTDRAGEAKAAAAAPQHVSPYASPMYCGLHVFASVSSPSLTPVFDGVRGLPSSSPVPQGDAAATFAAPRGSGAQEAQGPRADPPQHVAAQEVNDGEKQATKACTKPAIAAAAAVAGGMVRRSRPLSLSGCSDLDACAAEESGPRTGPRDGAPSDAAPPPPELLDNVTQDPAETSHTVTMPIMLAVHNRPVHSFHGGKALSGALAGAAVHTRVAGSAPLSAHTEGSTSSTTTRSRDNGLSITSPHTSKNTLSTASGSTIGTAAAGTSTTFVPPAVSRGPRPVRRHDLPPLTSSSSTNTASTVLRRSVQSNTPLTAVAPITHFPCTDMPNATTSASTVAGPAAAAAAAVVGPRVSLPTVVPLARSREVSSAGDAVTTTTTTTTTNAIINERGDQGGSGGSSGRGTTPTASALLLRSDRVASAARLNLRSSPTVVATTATAAAATAPCGGNAPSKPPRRSTRPPPHPRPAGATVPAPQTSHNSGGVAAAPAPHTVRRFVLRRASLRNGAAAPPHESAADATTTTAASATQKPAASAAAAAAPVKEEKEEERQEGASAVFSSPASQPYRCLSVSAEAAEANSLSTGQLHRVSGSPAIPQLRLHGGGGDDAACRYPGVNTSLQQSTSAVSTTSTRSGTCVPTTKRRLKSRPLVRSQPQLQTQQPPPRGSVTASTTSSFSSAMPQRQTHTQTSIPSLSLSISQPTTLVRAANPRRSLTSTSIACCSSSDMAAETLTFSRLQQQQQQQLVTPRPRGATPVGSSVSSPIVGFMSGSGLGDVVTRVTATVGASTTSHAAPRRAVRPRYLPQFTRPLRTHPKRHNQQQQQHEASSTSFVSTPSVSSNTPHWKSSSSGSAPLQSHPPTVLVTTASLSMTTILIESNHTNGSGAVAAGGVAHPLVEAAPDLAPAPSPPSSSSGLLLRRVQAASTLPGHGGPLFAEEKEEPVSVSPAPLFIRRRHEAAAATSPSASVSAAEAALMEEVVCCPPPPPTPYSVEGASGSSSPADLKGVADIPAEEAEDRLEKSGDLHEALQPEREQQAATARARSATPHAVVALPPPPATATAPPSSSRSEKDLKVAEVVVERPATPAVADSAETNTRPVEVAVVAPTLSSGAVRRRKTIVESVPDDAPEGLATATDAPLVVAAEQKDDPEAVAAAAAVVADPVASAADAPILCDTAPLHPSRHDATPFLCAAAPSINEEHPWCATEVANVASLQDTVALRTSGETLQSTTRAAAAAVGVAVSVSSDGCCAVVRPKSPLSASSVAHTPSALSSGGAAGGAAGVQTLTEMSGATGASTVTTAAALSSFAADTLVSNTTACGDGDDASPLVSYVADAPPQRLTVTEEAAAAAAATTAAAVVAVSHAPPHKSTASTAAPTAEVVAAPCSADAALAPHHPHPITSTLTNAAAVTETPTATACYHRSALFAFFAAGRTGGATTTTTAAAASPPVGSATGSGAVVTAAPARAHPASSFYSSFDRSSMRDDTAVATTATTMIFTRDPSSSELATASLNGRGALARRSSSPITRLTTLFFTYSSANPMEFCHSHEDGGSGAVGGRTPSHINRPSALTVPSVPGSHSVAVPSSVVSTPATATAVEDDVVGVRSVDTATTALPGGSVFATPHLTSPLGLRPQQQQQQQQQQAARPPLSPMLCTVPSSLALLPPSSAAAPAPAHAGQITTAMTATWCAAPSLRLQPTSTAASSALRPLAKRQWSSAVAQEGAAAVLSRRPSVVHTATKKAVNRTGSAHTALASVASASADGASRELPPLPVMDPTDIDRLRMEVCATNPGALRRNRRSFNNGGGGTHGSSDVSFIFPQRGRQPSHHRSSHDAGERRSGLDYTVARRATRIGPLWLSNHTTPTAATPTANPHDDNASREDSSDPTSSDSSNANNNNNGGHTHHHHHQRSNSREVTHLSFPSIAALMMSDDDDDDLLSNAPHEQGGLILVECDHDIDDVLWARAEVMRRAGRRPSDSRFALRRITSRFSPRSGGGSAEGVALTAAKPCLQSTSSFANRRWGDRRPQSGSHTRHASGELRGAVEERKVGGGAPTLVEKEEGSGVCLTEMDAAVAARAQSNNAAQNHSGSNNNNIQRHHHQRHSGGAVSQLRRAHPSVNRCPTAAVGVDDAPARYPWPTQRSFLLRPQDGGSESDESSDAALSHTRAGRDGGCHRSTAPSHISDGGPLRMPPRGEDGLMVAEGQSAAPARATSACGPTFADADAAEQISFAGPPRRRSCATGPFPTAGSAAEEESGVLLPYPVVDGGDLKALPPPPHQQQQQRTTSVVEPEDGGISPELSILTNARHRPLPLAVGPLALPDSTTAVAAGAAPYAAAGDGASPANASTTATAGGRGMAVAATPTVMLPAVLPAPQRRDRRTTTTPNARRRLSPSGMKPEPRTLQAAGAVAGGPPLPRAARSVLSESLTTVEGELVHLERPLQQQQQQLCDVTNISFVYHPLTLGELGAGTASPLLDNAISRSGFTFRSGFSSALVSNADSHFDGAARQTSAGDTDGEHESEEAQLAVVMTDGQCSASRRTVSLSQQEVSSTGGGGTGALRLRSDSDTPPPPVLNVTQVRPSRVSGSGAGHVVTTATTSAMATPPPVHGVPAQAHHRRPSAESPATVSHLTLPLDVLASIPLIASPAEVTGDAAAEAEASAEKKNGDLRMPVVVRSPCSSSDGSMQHLSPLLRHSAAAAVCPTLPFTLPAPPTAPVPPPTAAVADRGSPSIGPGILIPSRKWHGSSVMTTPTPAPIVAPAHSEHGERGSSGGGGGGSSRSGAPPFILEDAVAAAAASGAGTEGTGTSPTAAETYSRRRALRQRQTSFTTGPVEEAANGTNSSSNGGGGAAAAAASAVVVVADASGHLSPRPPSQPPTQQQQQQMLLMLGSASSPRPQPTTLGGLYLSPSGRRLSGVSTGKDGVAAIADAVVGDDGGAVTHPAVTPSSDSLRPQPCLSPQQLLQQQQQQQQQAVYRQRVSFCDDLAGQAGAPPPKGSPMATASPQPTILQRASVMSVGSVSPVTSPAGGSVLVLPHPPSIDSPREHGGSMSASIIHSNSRDGNEENKGVQTAERESPQIVGSPQAPSQRGRQMLPLLPSPQPQQLVEASEQRHDAHLKPILNDRTHGLLQLQQQQQQQTVNTKPGLSGQSTSLYVGEDGNSRCTTNGKDTGISPPAAISGDADGADGPAAAVVMAGAAGGEKVLARHYAPFTSRRSVARVGSVASCRSGSSGRAQNFDWAGSIVGSFATMNSNSLLSSPTDSDFG